MAATLAAPVATHSISQAIQVAKCSHSSTAGKGTRQHALAGSKGIPAAAARAEATAHAAAAAACQSTLDALSWAAAPSPRPALTPGLIPQQVVCVTQQQQRRHSHHLQQAGGSRGEALGRTDGSHGALGGAGEAGRACSGAGSRR